MGFLPGPPWECRAVLQGPLPGVGRGGVPPGAGSSRRRGKGLVTRSSCSPWSALSAPGPGRSDPTAPPPAPRGRLPSAARPTPPPPPSPGFSLVPLPWGWVPSTAPPQAIPSWAPHPTGGSRAGGHPRSPVRGRHPFTREPPPSGAHAPQRGSSPRAGRLGVALGSQLTPGAGPLPDGAGNPVLSGRGGAQGKQERRPLASRRGRSGGSRGGHEVAGLRRRCIEASGFQGASCP